GSRLHATAAYAPPVDDERLYRVTDALEQAAADTGKAVPQIALNWLLQRPSVATGLVGARHARQLEQNLGASHWSLSPAHRALLDAASAIPPPYPYYPYWNGMFTELAPPPVPRSREGAP